MGSMENNKTLVTWSHLSGDSYMVKTTINDIGITSEGVFSLLQLNAKLDRLFTGNKRV